MKHLDKKIETIYKDVFYFVLSKLYDEDLAYDITHNVMESILLHNSQLKKKAAFKSWVYTIATNEIKRYYKSLQLYNERFVSMNEDSSDVMELQLIKEEEDMVDLSKRLITQEEKRTLTAALLSLNEKYRIVIYLRVFCEYNLADIAEILNINASTVRSRYGRGLLKLKEAFERLEKGDLK